MKFGVVLPSYGPQATRLALIDALQLSESLGFDSAWLTDHLALPQTDASQFGHIFEALSTMAFLSASSGRIKLGLSALVLPQRNPVEVAKILATIDNLSGGRTMLAVGIGWSQGEYDNLGYNFQNRARRMDEYVRILRTLWRGQSPVNFEGSFFQIKEMVISPGPVQAGGPPLWIAGNSTHALKRAIFLADGWHPNATSPEQLETMLNPIRPMIQNRPFTVSLRFRLQFSEKMDDEKLLSGNPSDIVEQLRTYKAAGMNYAIINFLADNPAQRGRNMELFVREVISQLI